MHTLIFATNNENKVAEIKSVVGNLYDILSLSEAGINIDIPEPYNTLAENASEKTRVIHQLIKKNCFSEDTGLEVEALNGEPGVRSARYAGDDASSQANIEKLLFNLKEKNNREAKFRTVISLILADQEYQFEGACHGTITHSQAGEKGFGYDSVFIPDGASKTFAEMNMHEKNLFSHRKKATQKLLAFLSQNWKKLSP